MFEVYFAQSMFPGSDKQKHAVLVHLVIVLVEVVSRAISAGLILDRQGFAQTRRVQTPPGSKAIKREGGQKNSGQITDPKLTHSPALVTALVSTG